MQKEFPHWSEALSKVDPLYPSTTGPYTFTRSATLARGQSALSSLYSRPEHLIAVVSHSGFLRTAVSASHYANADYRVFTFKEGIEGGGGYELVEDEGTREKGGGKSDPGTPEEEPKCACEETRMGPDVGAVTG